MIAFYLLACGIYFRTFNADNVILTYEWFYDASQNIEARRHQIFDTEQQLREIGSVNSTHDADAHDRLLVELQG